jgi:hypothetical protein
VDTNLKTHVIRFLREGRKLISSEEGQPAIFSVVRIRFDHSRATTSQRAVRI